MRPPRRIEPMPADSGVAAKLIFIILVMLFIAGFTLLLNA